MREVIQDELRKIECRENIIILYACESGSRAWGFPSANSDYDVRFLYIRPVDWYLSIEEGRDVVEVPIEDDLDINGWDLRKALRLFRKSNPPLAEWLDSPIVYVDKFDLAKDLRKLACEYYSPLACAYHYLNTAKSTYQRHLQGEQVTAKKYFYSLRPLLAIKWIENGYGVPPTAFQKLVDTLVGNPELKCEIETLLERKRCETEKSKGPRIPVIHEYIVRELERLEAGIQAPIRNTPLDVMDNAFRHALKCWESVN